MTIMTERHLVCLDGSQDPAVLRRAPFVPPLTEGQVRARLRDLARRWPELPKVVRWMCLRGLAHPSLMLTEHPCGYVCDRPHLLCWWGLYVDAVGRLHGEGGDGEEFGHYPDELQERVLEAEFVLINGVSR